MLVYCFVEMGYINDDEVPCCSKDARREDESLLQKFVPVNVCSESSVRTRICASLGSRMKFKTLCYPVFGRNKNTALPSF